MPANFSSIPAAKMKGDVDFAGQYAHSSLQPAADYVPRLTLQQKIRDQLHAFADPNDDESRTVVVWGLGGSGKSQLVLNYIREYGREYRAVFWVEASEKETIKRDYIQIYRLLFPEVADRSGSSISAEDAVPAVKNWFQRQQGRSLLVLDSADSIENAEDPSYVDLNYYLPKAPRVDTIVTTRSSQALKMSSLEAVEVGEMMTPEAVELFHKCAKLSTTSQETKEEIRAIVNELGYLALAIMLAGAYVAATPRLSLNIRLYLPQYRKHRGRFLRQKAIQNVHQYGESVFSTWETTFAAVERQSRVASRLLCLLAFLNFDDIFPSLFDVTPSFEEAVDNNGQTERLQWLALLSPETTVDQFAIESGFATLQTYSLVSWRSAQGAYRMHPLVHTWVRERLELDQRRTWSLAALELLSENIEKYLGDFAMETRLVPHVMSNFTAMSTCCGVSYPFKNQDRDSVARIGNFLRQLRQWAYEYDVRIFHVQVSEEILGTKHPDTLTSMSSLAEVLRDQDRYEEAEEMHQRTLKLREIVLGTEHPDTLMSMNNLAEVLRDQGKYEEAEGLLQRTLKLREMVLGTEHPSTLISINNLAMVLRDQGKYEEAKGMLQQTLRLREMKLGEEHPSTMTSINNLAILLSDQGKYEEAEEMLRRTLKLRGIVLGIEHPDTLTSMNNLAEVLRDQGKYKEAEELHRQTLELMERVLGNEHPSTLASEGNLALVLSGQGKYEEAEEIYQRTLKLREMALGREHPSTLTSIANLASTYQNQGRWKEAEELEVQVLETEKRVLGKEHPDTLISMANLASTYRNQGRWKEAEELEVQVLETEKRVLGEEHPDTLISMANLASTYRNQGRWKEAEELEVQVLETEKRVLGEEHPDTLTSMANLACILKDQNRNSEATELMTSCLKLRMKVLGPLHPQTQSIMGVLSAWLHMEGDRVDQEEQSVNDIPRA